MASAAYYLRKTFVFISLLVGDLLALQFMLWLSVLLRNRLAPLLHFEPVDFGFLLSRGFHWQMSLLLFFVFIIENLYFSRNTFSEEFRRIIRAGLIIALSAGFFIYIAKKEFYYSRLSVGIFTLLFLCFMPFFRRLWKNLLFRLGIWRKQAWLVGDHLPELLQRIIADPLLGYQVRHFPLTALQPDELAGLPPSRDGVSRDLILSFKKPDLAALGAFLQKVEFDFESVRVFNHFYSGMFGFFNLERNGLAGFFSIRRQLLKPHNLLLKRLFDIILSAVILLLLAPVLLVLMVLLAILQRGRVFYFQERLGRNGRSFKMIKFRSMVPESEKVLNDYFKVHPREKDAYDRFRKFTSPGRDPRLTLLGRFMRRWSIDELPQFLMVLKGSMSLVGPRPYLVDTEKVHP